VLTYLCCSGQSLYHLRRLYSTELKRWSQSTVSQRHRISLLMRTRISAPPNGKVGGYHRSRRTGRNCSYFDCTHGFVTTSTHNAPIPQPVLDIIGERTASPAVIASTPGASQPETADVSVAPSGATSAPATTASASQTDSRPVLRFSDIPYAVRQCSRKRVQQLKKRKKSCFLDFEKNVKNVKNVRILLWAT